MIIVTGPGRSGTSLVTKLLSLGGAEFPDSTDWEDDVRAGLENSQIVNINKIIYSINGAYDFYGTSWIREEQEKTTAEMIGEVLRIYDKKYKNKYIKDPLFSKTIGVWHKSEVNIEHVVVCIRDAHNVVHSAIESKRGFESGIEHSQEAMFGEVYARMGYLFHFLMYNNIPYSVIRYENIKEDMQNIAGILRINIEPINNFLSENYEQRKHNS